MQHTDPKRVVLRFSVDYELQGEDIIEQFFALSGPQPATKDFYSHLMAPNESSSMHIVLDLHCKAVPTVDLSMIPYEVFKVTKQGLLYVFESS
jgi:hypothetical protein